MKIINVLILGMSIIVLPIYSQDYYAPDDGITLMIAEKGDFNTSLGFSFTESFNFQAGFSPIKHLAISGHYLKIAGSYFHNKGNLKQSGVAIGTYFFLENKKLNRKRNITRLSKKSGVLLDLYMGYGKGKTENVYRYGGSSLLSFKKYYFQPGVHFKGKLWSVSCVIKIANVSYTEIQEIGNIGYYDLYDLQKIKQFNPFNLIEQSYRFQLRFSHFTLFIHTTYAKVKSRKLNLIHDQSTLGLTLNINEFYKKKKPKS